MCPTYTLNLQKYLLQNKSSFWVSPFFFFFSTTKNNKAMAWPYLSYMCQDIGGNAILLYMSMKTSFLKARKAARFRSKILLILYNLEADCGLLGF